MGVAMLKFNGEMLFVKKEKGLLSGLWGLPAVEGKNKTEAEKNLLSVVEDFNLKVEKYKRLGEITHVFTHRTWKMQVYNIDVTPKVNNFSKEEEEDYDEDKVLWLKKEEISDYGISTAFQKVLDQFST